MICGGGGVFVAAGVFVASGVFVGAGVVGEGVADGRSVGRLVGKPRPNVAVGDGKNGLVAVRKGVCVGACVVIAGWVASTVAGGAAVRVSTVCVSGGARK